MLWCLGKGLQHGGRPDGKRIFFLSSVGEDDNHHHHRYLVIIIIYLIMVVSEAFLGVKFMDKNYLVFKIL